MENRQPLEILYPSTDLTTRQASIFEFLVRHVAHYGFPPTVREIGREFGIKSPNGVIANLKALEKKGWIRRDGMLSRAIHILRGQPNPARDEALSIFAEIAAQTGVTVGVVMLAAAKAYRKRVGNG